MFTYKLSNLFPQGEKFRVNHIDKETGKPTSTIIRFEAGKTYHSDDEVLKQSLLALRGKYSKTSNNKAFLDKTGVNYTEEPCKSCGGRVIKFVVNYFDVTDEDD